MCVRVHVRMSTCTYIYIYPPHTYAHYVYKSIQLIYMTIFDNQPLKHMQILDLFKLLSFFLLLNLPKLIKSINITSLGEHIFLWADTLILLGLFVYVVTNKSEDHTTRPRNWDFNSQYIWEWFPWQSSVWPDFFLYIFNHTTTCMSLGHVTFIF